MSKFEIKNFFEFNDGSANFSLNTAGGFYYDCKLVSHNGGHFVASAQSRSFDKKEGGKGYVRAFGAERDTAAAKFLDEVAEEAIKLLKAEKQQPEEPPYNPDSDIPF